IRAPLTRKVPTTDIVAITRTSAANRTGPTKSRTRNTERRDHSIWPNDRSNTRATEAENDGGACEPAPARGGTTGTACVRTSPDTSTPPGGCRRATLPRESTRVLRWPPAPSSEHRIHPVSPSGRRERRLRTGGSRGGLRQKILAPAHEVRQLG